MDIDFANLDTDSVHLTVGGRDFWQAFEIPKRPKFCKHCKIIGHTDEECRKKTSVKLQAKGLQKNDKNEGDGGKVSGVVPNLHSSVSKDGFATVTGSNKNSNTWKEVRRKKNGHVGTFGVVGTVNETVHTLLEFEEEKELDISDFSGVVAQLKAQVEQGEELSAEERLTLELGKKLEEDLANLLKAGEDLERATKAYKDFSSNSLGKPTSSGVILSPNKFSVLKDEKLLICVAYKAVLLWIIQVIGMLFRKELHRRTKIFLQNRQVH